ncbi:MAG: gamma-glutamyl-gamma-aminobutyrate hydrolase family protein [Tannerellaceae bacterium]|jgi:microsomal dipeptidase-like Zn-dependent dipeptidase/gamma-glutamyl-gamma-aminobutyrate hydrolase PuuD|nr:gamma-glutamyl-gamma-aminobutyrate hydrolase family protein [Tannerellaceae bacterium]
MNANAIRHPDMGALLREVDDFVPSHGRKAPCIGISANRKEGASSVAADYVSSVLQAGGVPVIIPVVNDTEALSVIVDGLDGLLVTGGGDLNPLFTGEEPLPALGQTDSLRDEYDLILIRLAFNRGLPILGICRGHQVVNAVFGGSLYQDIYSQHAAWQQQGIIKHSQDLSRELPSHSVELTGNGSRLYSIMGDGRLAVNSFHHQAVKNPAPGFIATAFSPDGINEATEHPHYPVMSVQWHPESMAAAGDERMQGIFHHHVEESALFLRAKDLHRTALTIDLHTDAPMAYAGDFDLGRRICGTFNEPFTEGRVSLPLMEQGRIDAAFMVAYIPQCELTDAARLEAYDYALDRLAQVTRQAVLHPSRTGIARTPQDILRLRGEGKKALLLGVENGYAIGRDLERLEAFKRLGVCYITLCHEGYNDICDSSYGTPEWSGLSYFGREVVAAMNRLGIMIDVSHAAETTFYDVLELSSVPVIASHSSAYALCDHPRNLTDAQIRAISERGGIVNICLYAGFLRRGAGMDDASIDDAVRHIDHAVSIAGPAHVGIGSDFDGGGGVNGCRAANELIHLTTRLIRAGYSEDDIAAIWGGNLLRVMTAVQSPLTT